jgi:hypothetical protein
MLTVFTWLQLAITAEPFRNAHYVAKLDDDCFIRVPEMCVHLRKLRVKPHVYYGIYYATTWYPHLYKNGASGYGIGTVAKSNRACLTNGNCSAPYVFAAAPAQIISLDLARVLASSPAAIEYTTKSREILNDPVRSRTFASEDSWLGFALSDLLPANFTGITLADIERFTYTFDDWGARMTPFTMFFHDKQKKAHRIIAAYHYSLAHSCDSNVQITCSKRDEQRRTSESCRLLPGNRSPGSRDRFQNCSRGGPPAGDLRYSPYYSCLTNSPAQQQRAQDTSRTSAWALAPHHTWERTRALLQRAPASIGFCSLACHAQV